MVYDCTGLLLVAQFMLFLFNCLWHNFFLRWYAYLCVWMFVCYLNWNSSNMLSCVNISSITGTFMIITLAVTHYTANTSTRFFWIFDEGLLCLSALINSSDYTVLREVSREQGTNNISFTFHNFIPQHLVLLSWDASVSSNWISYLAKIVLSKAS
jgi:hypothetical protein